MNPNMENSFNIYDCCRACLRTECVLISTLQEDRDSIKYLDKLNVCISDIVWQKDGLPILICATCIENLRSAYNFRNTCLHSDQALLRYINQLQDETNCSTPLIKVPKVEFNSSDPLENSSTIALTVPAHNLKQSFDHKDVVLNVKMSPKENDVHDSEMEHVVEQIKHFEHVDLQQQSPIYETSKVFDDAPYPIKTEIEQDDEEGSDRKSELIDTIEEIQFKVEPEEILGLESDSDTDCTPPEIKEIARNATLELLPVKSREIYENNYARFMAWRVNHNTDSFSENVVIAYFTDLSTKVKPSTLWTHYSMLKATLNVKHAIDIKKYSKLIPYLNSKSRGYQPQSKESKSLTEEQVNKFLTEAPDDKYLMTKVCLIIGVSGALRRDELTNLKIGDICDMQTALSIKVPDKRANKFRYFTVTGDEYLRLYRKYSSIRPPDMNNDRFFIKYQNGKCHRHVVGVHKISSTAQEVASYLQLPDIKAYNGHCLRKTAATLLIDSVADFTPNCSDFGR